MSTEKKVDESGWNPMEKEMPASVPEGFFLQRPVMSAVISIFFILMGVLSIGVLPISQYPDLIPPTILVSAQYPGASPEVISQTVASPLEEQINGVEDMIYMSSISSVSGQMSLSVTFAVGTDADIATINVNNRVQAAMATLPSVVRQYGVTVNKQSAAILQIVTISAVQGMFDDVYVSNYALINVIDSLKRLKGVGEAQILGAKNYSMRIWLNPQRMAQLNLSPSDIAQAVEDQNNEYAAGTIGSLPAAEGSEPVAMTWQINTQGRLLNAEEFGNIILRTDAETGVLRIKDVARVELGAESYDFEGQLNGQNTVPIAIFLSPGANALQTATLVEQTMAKLADRFPYGITYEIPYDTTSYVRLSIDEVVKTLGEAMLLVFVVVYLFLQNWRATLIPCLAVPISLVGTFAGIYVLGFTINTLTLFALVLAIGMVVDDAIVVLENVERVLASEDLTVRQATAKAMHEVTSAVIAIVLVLCAVFIPVAFLSGLVGVMYRQFAVTIALSVTISGIVALTLTPSLCVLLLKKERHQPAAIFRAFNRMFEKITNGFTAGVRFFLHKNILSIAILCIIVYATGDLFNRVPASLVPNEDQGYVMCMITMPEGTSLSKTAVLSRSVTSEILAMPAVSKVLTLTGFDMMNNTISGNAGTLFIMLKSWSEREKLGITLDEVLGQIYAIGLSKPEGLVLPFNPPPIMGMSNTGGFQMMLQSVDGNLKDLADVSREFVSAANKRPELTDVSTGFSSSAPRLYIDLDREKARLLNVNVADVFNTLGATLGSSYINDFTYEGRNFRVRMQADGQYRSLPEDIRYLYVTSQDGQQVPMLSLISVRTDGGPQNIQRFNGFVAAQITGNSGSGYSSGQSITALEEVAAQVLPNGYSYAWTAATYQEVETGGTDYGVLLLSLLMVFLILAAQYERWALPFSVLSAVPFALLGAIFSNWMLGLDNDIYTQIAMITLLGLASKNAILIVEFAFDLQKGGMSITDSAVEAAKLRFRPIIMTSIAFILGCLPLALSKSAGAASRVSIGVSIVGGMIAATVLAPLLVPYFYRLVLVISARLRGIHED